MPASIGRDYAVYYSYDTSRTVIPTNYFRVGSLRNKSFGVEWETVDATTDTSRNQTRENLVTFKSFNPSFSGLADDDETLKLDELEDYITNPASGQPRGWIRLERPAKNGTIKTYDIPVQSTSFNFTANYDQPAEFNFENISDGGVTITYV
ncbi:MAG: phage tail protein [Acidiferrobacterales bacterium]|nr:phage tail protein [Acidiferrobacterales bacterium]